MANHVNRNNFDENAEDIHNLRISITMSVN